MAEFLSVAAQMGHARLTKAKGLRRWQAAFDDRFQKSPLAYVIGDSQVAAVGIDGTTAIPSEQDAELFGYPGLLKRQFAQFLGTPECGVIKAHFPTSDSRITNTGTVSTSGSYGIGGLSRIFSSSTWKETFAVPRCTAIDAIVYESQSTTIVGGNAELQTTGFSITVDGGAPTNFTNSGMAGGYRKVSVEGLSDATHTVDFAATATGSPAVVLVALIYRSAGGVIIGHFGRSGWTTADFDGQGGNSNLATELQRSRVQKSFSMGAPDLAVIETGVNDCQNQLNASYLTTPASYKSRLSSDIDSVVDGGGCVLLLSSPLQPYGPPSGGAPYTDYVEAMEELALENDHVAHISIPNLWGTNADAMEMAYQVNGSVHSTKKGNGSRANWLYRLLTQHDFGMLT